MDGVEYKVVAAPRRGVRKGPKSAEDRFALAVEGEISRLAAEGWEYLRSDTFPCEERQGWFGKAETLYRTVMVFRRAPVAAVAAAGAPAVGRDAEEPARWSPPPRTLRATPAPAAASPAPASAPAPAAAPAPGAGPAASPAAAAPLSEWPLERLRPALRARETSPPQRRAAPPMSAPARTELDEVQPSAGSPPEEGWPDPVPPSRG